MKSSITHMKISTINDHNPDQNTDKLYQPLRHIIFDPETVIDHQIQSPIAASRSLIHDSYKKLSMVQIAHFKRDFLIPIEQQLIPTQDYSKVDKKQFRIVDVQQKVIGGLLTKQEVEEAIKNKKDSRIVYELGNKSDHKVVSTQRNSVSQLLKYNKSNPNLRSQIFGNQIKGLVQIPSMKELNKQLGRYKSQSQLPLPTYDEIKNWLTFKERQSLKKMRQSQVNPEAKGYIYEYNITEDGPSVKTKLNRYPSHGSIKGSTIMDAIPIPISNIKDESSPNSPLRKHIQNISTSFIQNPETPVIRRQYYNNAPIPMVQQSHRIVLESPLVNRGQISVEEAFSTPIKVRTQQDLKELKQLPTTAAKPIIEEKKEKIEQVNYTYNVKDIDDDKKIGCGFCNGQ